MTSEVAVGDRVRHLSTGRVGMVVGFVGLTSAVVSWDDSDGGYDEVPLPALRVVKR